MSSKSPACIHRILEGNIQEFILTEVSRRALDELFDITEKNLSETVQSSLPAFANPVLIDSSVGLQSVNHSLIRLRAMMGRFPDRRKGLIAIILPANPLVRTIAMMMRPIAPMRMYIPQEREQALAWLRTSVEAKR